MAVPDVEQLLADRLGFDPATIGPAAVRSTISQAMADAQYRDLTAYAQRLLADPAAWEKLVDRVVVCETSFFRDVAPFALAADRAWASRQRDARRTVRILSSPCATGEEPYSLAMALFDKGLTADAFTIDAVDVSSRAVERTRSGVFRGNSFRGDDLGYRTRYFVRTPEGFWRLRDEVRRSVRVRQANMLASDFLSDELPFDIVFCRNLLIYLHAGAKAAVMNNVRRLLAPGALLVVGHAEAAIAREHGFKPTGPPGAFGFVHAGRHAALKPPAHARVPHRRPPAPATRPFLDATAANSRHARAAVAPAAATEEEPTLTRARRFADAGQLQEAIRICAEYLKRVPGSAEAHFLMGVLHGAEGRWQLASPSFRRALYLDPFHVDALHHLALKHEATGDRVGAALLRARARRAGEASSGD